MGSRSATIRSLTDEFQNGDFGTLMQQISAKNYVVKRVRFSGFVKTKEVEGWCGLWFRIDALLGVTLKLDVDKHTPTTDFVPEEVFPDLLLNPQFEEL